MNRIMNFNDPSLYNEFEKLVQTILEKNGFEVVIPSKDKGYDFIARIDTTISFV